MITVGAFEAKTQLSSLLDRAAAGEEVVITKHGKPVARLVAAQLPISVDQETTGRAWREILMLARTEGLTTYDATYLELAVRRGLPLLREVTNSALPHVVWAPSFFHDRRPARQSCRVSIPKKQTFGPVLL